jgi:PAS domain S-box-containing protein
LFAVSFAAPAAAQTHREPLDLPTTGWVTTGTGLVPFAAEDHRGGAGPNLDDSGWRGVLLPGLWHRSLPGELPSVAWYRIHVRVNDLDADRAMLLPPVYGAWVAYLNGRRLGASGRIGDPSAPSEERSHLLPLTNLELGDNVIAIKTSRYGRWGGFGGPVRLGSRAALARHARLRDLLSAGVCILFLGIFFFQVALFAAERRDRAPLWFGLSGAAGAMYLLGTYDFYYLFADDTEAKLRLKVFALLLGHAAAMMYAHGLLQAPNRWGPNVAAGAAAVGTLVAGLGSVAAVQVTFGLSWILTLGCLGWALWLAGRLPLRSPIVRAGARAGLVGLMLTLGYDGWQGLLEVRGAGTFEFAFVPFCATVLGALVIEHSVMRSSAARILTADRDGITVIDHHGVIRLANPAMAELLGGAGADLQGLVITSRLLGPSRPAVSETIRRLGAAGVEPLSESYEVSLETPAGVVVAEIQATNLDEERILLSFRDLTDRRRLEAEVARSQRLDSLGMLAGGIAHDFNNLLAGILVSAGEMQREAEQQFGTADPRVVAIVTEARRGGALTERLLQFARGRTSQPVGVDLERAVPDMVELLARTLGRNIEWKIELVATETTAAIDEGELEQILVNLCVNARDAMAPKGGTVVVRVEDAEDDQVALIVRDAGRGIPPELLDRVYEPFVTTKGAGAGTGLGLAVVHGIVRRRGGLIDIQSEVGEGTQVRVRLPVLEGDLTVTTRVAIAQEPPPSLQLDVLLVDDEPTLRTFLTRALQRRGLTVTVLEGGREVIEWLEEQGSVAPVDAVVMDMMMPGIDGGEATRALRERWPGLPVVISSGYTGRDDISELQASGPTEILRKPYRVEDLLEAFQRVTADPPA